MPSRTTPRVVEIELGTFFEHGSGLVEHCQSMLVHFAKTLHPHVMGGEAIVTALIRDHKKALDPDRARSRNRAHGATEAGLVGKVLQVNSYTGVEFAPARYERSGTRGLEKAERITHAVRVSPEPVDLVVPEHGHDPILAGYLGVREWMVQGRSKAEKVAVPIDSLSCHAVKSFGNVEPLDLDFGRPAHLGVQSDSTEPKPILGILIPVALHLKKTFPPMSPGSRNATRPALSVT